MKYNLFALKRPVLVTVLLLSVAPVFAQQKIKDGTVAGSDVPNANAVLDLESNNKGLLMPRVALSATASATPLTAHVAGMTVYNTATAGDVTPGYYYNDGAKWVRVLDLNALQAWNLKGNAGTNPAGGTSTGTDFLGTTDTMSFQIKAGGFDIMRAKGTNGHVQFGNWLNTSLSPNIPNPDRFLTASGAIVDLPASFTVSNNFAAADLTGTQVSNFRAHAYVRASSSIPFFGNVLYTQFNNGYTGPIQGGAMQLQLAGTGMTYTASGNNFIAGSQSTVSLFTGNTANAGGGIVGMVGTIAGSSGTATFNSPAYGVLGRTSTSGIYNAEVVAVRGSIEAVSAGITYNSNVFGTQGIVSQGNHNGTVIGAAGMITGGLYNTGTRQIGLYSNVSASNAKSAYGLYIDTVFSSTSRFGIYQSGTLDSNYFAGRVGIGISNPTNALHVNAASNPLRLIGLQSGTATDSVLTTDATGVVRRRSVASVTGSTLSANALQYTLTATDVANGYADITLSSIADYSATAKLFLTMESDISATVNIARSNRTATAARIKFGAANTGDIINILVVK